MRDSVKTAISNDTSGSGNRIFFTQGYMSQNEFSLRILSTLLQTRFDRSCVYPGRVADRISDVTTSCTSAPDFVRPTKRFDEGWGCDLKGSDNSSTWQRKDGTSGLMIRPHSERMSSVHTEYTSLYNSYS